MATLSRRSLLRATMGSGGGWDVGAPLCRQCRRDERDRVVGARLCRGRGHRVPENRCRLPESERQHDRLQHHSVCPGASKDHLGGDERRGSGPVPEQPSRNHRAVAWEDKLLDVTDVVNTQKEEYTDTALLSTYCYNSVPNSAAITVSPIRPPYCQIMFGSRWSRRPATKSRISRKPGTPITISSRTCKEAARPRRAQRLWTGLPGHDQWRRPQQHLPLFPDRLWRPGHRHQGRQAPPRRSEGEGGRDQGADLPDHRLQGRLCAAECDQLERCRRQQRLPRQDHRDGPRRHHLDRGRALPQEGGIRRHRDNGPAAQQRRQAAAEPRRQRLRRDPEGGEECRRRQGISEVFYPTKGQQRVSEGRARPQYFVHAVDRQRRPVVAADPHRAAYTKQGLLGPTLPQYSASTRPTLRCRTSMSGAWPGPTSCKAG